MSAQNIRALMESVKSANKDAVVSELIERLQVYPDGTFWNIIAAIGWGSFTTDYDAVGEALVKVFQPKQIEELKNKAVQHREALQKRVTEYEQERGIDNLYDVSDDSFWDYTAHLVGMGEFVYRSAMKNPAKFVGLDYEENFEYSFNID